MRKKIKNRALLVLFCLLILIFSGAIICLILGQNGDGDVNDEMLKTDVFTKNQSVKDDLKVMEREVRNNDSGDSIGDLEKPDNIDEDQWEYIKEFVKYKKSNVTTHPHQAQNHEWSRPGPFE